MIVEFEFADKTTLCCDFIGGRPPNRPDKYAAYLRKRVPRLVHVVRDIVRSPSLAASRPTGIFIKPTCWPDWDQHPELFDVTVEFVERLAKELNAR